MKETREKGIPSPDHPGLFQTADNVGVCDPSSAAKAGQTGGYRGRSWGSGVKGQIWRSTLLYIHGLWHTG